MDYDFPIPLKLLEQKMSQSLEKKTEQLETTKHTEESSIIQEKLPHQQNGQTVRRYAKGKLLGKGGFAHCYEATNVDSKKMSAIKIVNKQTLKKTKAKQKLITEIKIHKSLKHRRIVGFDHVFEDSDNVYILLELCSPNTLNDLLKKRKRLTQFEAQYFISQLVEGLIYIHESKIIHRDLKLGNLMLTEAMELKIGDFGLAAKVQSFGQRKKTVCGTPNYIAPEILEGKGHSYQVDIWSMGVILYALLYGKAPFQTSDVKKTYKKIKECQYAFIEEIPISPSAKNLISRLLVADPSKRITLQQINQHPFLVDNRTPDSLPPSILNHPLPRSFMDTCFKRPSNQDRSEKTNTGMSDRLLLRSSSGLGRCYFTKTAMEKGNNHRVTTNNFFSTPSVAAEASNNKRAKEIIMQGNFDKTFVRKWVDYSSKYGLGYLLSDRSTGIFFNDRTKTVESFQGGEIDYVDCKGQITSHKADSQPSDREVAKKFTLLQYFKKYLNAGTLDKDVKKKFNNICYVKQWAKTEQGIIFRLSNKILQVNYNDRSQLMLYTQHCVGVYSDVNSVEKVFFELGGNEEKTPILKKKVEQMKEMMKILRSSKVNVIIDDQ